MRKTIDSTAPLAAKRDVFIAAPLERVWTLQTNIEGWPQWQPDIHSAHLDGELAVGTVFRWKAKGLNIVSTLQTVEPQHEIGWTGSSLGMFAIHNWTFEAQNRGTRVTTAESLSGWMARLLKLFDPNFLDKSLAATLQTLKTAAETAQ